MTAGRNVATGTAGTWVLTRFALRRDRVRLPVWVLSIAGMIYAQSVQSQQLYDTPESLAALERTVSGNAAIIAFSGRPVGLETVGGEMVFEIFASAAVVTALMTMFTVMRHTRGDEEAGRTELLRAARLGRRAPALAAVLVAMVANAAVFAAVALVGVGTRLPATGSVLLGAALAGVGLTFAGTAVAVAQFAEHARAGSGLVGVVLGAAFVLRAAGDVGGNGLSWLSPIGWGQAVQPYSLDRWWPVLLCAGAGAAQLALALVLLERRDLGAGLIAPRVGAANAPAYLSSPLGLAWRLQRASVVAWTAGVAVFAMVFASLLPAVEDLLADNPDLAEFVPGGAEDLANGYLSMSLTMAAVLAAAFAVSSVLRARAEEMAGRAEPIVATATSRVAWFGSHLVLALGGAALLLVVAGGATAMVASLVDVEVAGWTDTLTAAVAYVPAVWVVAAVAAVVVAYAPAASVGTWGLIGYSTLSTLFVTSFGWPTWMQLASPIDHTPAGPLEPFGWTPVVALLLAASMVLGAALIGIRRRDIA